MFTQQTLFLISKPQKNMKYPINVDINKTQILNGILVMDKKI